MRDADDFIRLIAGCTERFVVTVLVETCRRTQQLLNNLSAISSHSTPQNLDAASADPLQPTHAAVVMRTRTQFGKRAFSVCGPGTRFLLTLETFILLRLVVKL